MLWLLWILAIPVVLAAATGWFVSQQVTERRNPDTQTSPSKFGLDYQDITFTTKDGIALRGWLIPGGNHSRAVIFCHGHAGSMDPDVQYAPWFHARGYSVLMFDFRGHGRSDGDRVSMGYFERRDLLAAEAWLAKQGYERIGVLGFSMGGAVAISTAPLSRHLLAVVADGSFAWLKRAIAAGIRERGAPSWLADAAAWLGIKFASWRLGANLGEADPALWVSKVSPRALFLIHGENDSYTDTEEVRAMYAAAADPKELWVVPGAGHRNVDVLEREEYHRRVLAFFDRWLGGEGA